tara:strand:- start:2603 stop:3034 length:432 start_codon:yes stop_codon:yes gene_type:complete
VKKKYEVTPKDKEDWESFAKKIGNIAPKEEDIEKKNIKILKVPKLDLHGISLSEANIKVKDFITKSFDNGYKKIIIITGKGLRSKFYNDPFVSEKLSSLKNSVPDYIKRDEDLSNKINRISTAEIKDGGEGAIYIFLKNKENL